MPSSTPTLSEAARHVILPKGIATTGWPSVRDTCLQVGITFDPWQDGAGTAILGKRKDGLYAAEAVVLSIPRQVGKTYLIGAIIFALCLANPGTLVLWTAHRYPTANETFQSMKTMVEQPKLRPHIVSASNPGGNGVIRFRNGSRILFGARERGFGRGFQRVAIIVFDEGQILTQAALDDMIPATNTHPNPLVFFIGTPPKPTDPSDVFINMRHEALSGESGDYLYVEFSADEDADPGDREQWAKANPSYPHRTTPRAILRMKRLLGIESFLREGLGIWDRVGGLGIFTAGAWARCFIGYLADGKTVAEPVGEPLSLGVAADLDQTWLSLGAAVGNDGKHHLGSVLRCRADVDAERFVAEVRRLQDSYDVPVGIDKKGPASFLIPALEAACVRLTFLGLDDFVQACSDLRSAVEQGTVTHGDYDDLNAAVDASGWRRVGERRVFARKSGDISSLEAVAIALRISQNPGTYDPLESIY
ncbi:MAG: terminase [Nocardioidaceae bacterium]|nr:terminase [Dermatophilaceae bacterium]NUR05857.1 terminase [Nocardioidaceae bacterium]NUR80025.1 terminase [Dermatophilaceae bacterium]